MCVCVWGGLGKLGPCFGRQQPTLLTGNKSRNKFNKEFVENIVSTAGYKDGHGGLDLGSFLDIRLLDISDRLTSDSGTRIRGFLGASLLSPALSPSAS